MEMGRHTATGKHTEDRQIYGDTVTGRDIRFIVIGGGRKGMFKFPESMMQGLLVQES